MTTNFYNLIDKYILGKLKDKKLFEFQSELDISPELAAEVQFQTDLSEAIT
ncbi:MAG: hypothetical protein PF541_18335 [Prolixibacteraceae bacterium]|jgi:hypothetical protein|nr:hypothetical protein [Prolixibacteraceae bacterium]